MVLEGDPLLYPTLLQLQWRYPDYANHHLIGQAPQCRYNDPGMEEGEGVDMYNPNLVMMNNPSPSVANTAIMNKLSSSLANAPLYIPPNSQAPKCRENPPPMFTRDSGERDSSPRDSTRRDSSERDSLGRDSSRRDSCVSS